MRYLIFGTGDYYNRYKKWFDQQEVVALLDNSEQKQYTRIDGIEVLPPMEGIRLDYDVVVILSFHFKIMKQQLFDLGVDEKCIYHFYDLYKLLAEHVVRRPIQYFNNAENILKVDSALKMKILLMSNDLALGGPAIALFHAAIVLKEYGYEVVYASMIDGPLREKLFEKDIPIMVDENLQIATMKGTEWVESFSLIICNTLNYHAFLSDRNTAIPVIWWLHDTRFFYDGVKREVMRKIKLDNLSVVSVGLVPEMAIKEFLPEVQCGKLLYGVADSTANITEIKPSDFVLQKEKLSDFVKIRFITIGFLEERKGQDILLHAIKKLPDHIRNRCEFYIVGYDETMFGEEIRRRSVGISEIIFTGSVDRVKIHELLSCSDVLICPSRQDPMPTVAAEAMMHSIPCIVSDATGTAAYIHEGEDGFIVPMENVLILAEKIEWCVANRGRLADIGQKARKLYEKYFSMKTFENNFIRVVNEALINKN